MILSKDIPETISGYEIVGAIPDARTESIWQLLGRKDLPTVKSTVWATWEWSPAGGAYWGHYDLPSYSRALADLMRRTIGSRL